MKYLRTIAVTVTAALLLVAQASNVLAGDASKGKTIYDGKGACGACHGPSGKGDGAAAAAMNPKPRSFADGQFQYDTDGDGKSGSDSDLLNILKNGTANYGGSPTMPPRADIPDGELLDLIAFIRTLKN